MNRSIKALILVVAVIVVSLISCSVIIHGGPMDQAYNSSVLIVKGIMTSGAIIAISVSLAILLKE